MNDPELENETNATQKGDYKFKETLNNEEGINQSRGDYKRTSKLANSSNISSLRVGSLLRAWAEVSQINYFSSQPLDVVTLGHSSIRRRSIGVPSQTSIENFLPAILQDRSIAELFTEQFPSNVRPLINEDQHWCCFYNYPEHYADAYSPIEKVLDSRDVTEPVEGVLTRDMVAASLSYLKRSPILGDFVLIKLDLAGKQLVDIKVLEYYKYLVYLDLSSNLPTEVSVLSHLPYLQYLSVAYNRLCTVLEYDTPQWFLTEVHYKFNSVKRIRDLAAFWSITVLDLSHNNIKAISGLESLRYLRRLDISFNHIQRIENLNHLRLLWLDLSYNNISSFEFSDDAGLWTLLHLQYLNLNENNLTSMKVFSGCVRLRELHARNNRLSMLLELAVYMRNLRSLVIMDLRGNAVCSVLGYKNVVCSTFPVLLSLDGEQLDPVEQRTSKMEMTPQIDIFSSRRLLRLLYVEQLSRARVSQFVPPADTTEVPIVVLVGYEGVGKGQLSRRLATECSDHISLAVQHTTSPHHLPGHYKQVSREKFDDMVCAGEFLTYTEIHGESYGLSREEAFIRDGKVRVACMDLISALMLKHRGRRPTLVLCYRHDKLALVKTQQQRRLYRNLASEQRQSLETPLTRSMLQVMVSGRIIITGILNEILLCLPEDKERSEFVMESGCSLMMDSETRAAHDFTRGVNLLTNLAISSTSLMEACKKIREKTNHKEGSLYSLYKESQATGEYISNANEHSFQERKFTFSSDVNSQPAKEKLSCIPRPKSVDFSQCTSSTWRERLSTAGPGPVTSKSSKSVTFTATEEPSHEVDPIGMMLDPPVSTMEKHGEGNTMWSISGRLPRRHIRRGSSYDDDLLLAFFIDTGIAQASDLLSDTSDQSAIGHRDLHTKLDDPEMLIREIICYTQTHHETLTRTVRDDYEGIHRLTAGLFYDTIAMDDSEAAFLKTKKLIQGLVHSQQNLTAMFDINFANLQGYPNVEKRLSEICDQIAPQRLFN